MVLLLLAVVWGLVLFSWLRSRTADGAFSDSVGTFRRHLRVLGQTAPVTVQPANRMRSGYVAGRPPTTYGQPSSPTMRAVTPRYGRPPLRPPTTAAIRRREAQKRRRNVMLLLMAIVGLIMLLAAMTTSKGAIIALFVAVLALVAYIGLLVRARNLAAEREMKLTYLSQIRREAAGRPPAASRRRPASTPRRPPAPRYETPGDEAGDYEVAPGYGQLALRRVAT